MTEIAEQLSCQELVELVTDYLDGALPPPDRARFEAHIAGCDGCRAYLEQIGVTIAAQRHAAPRAARPRRGGGAARGLPRLEAQTVSPGPVRHLSGEPGADRRRRAQVRHWSCRLRSGVSPGSTMCRDAPRCSARPRPPASGSRRGRVPKWKRGAPLPLARGEVAAAVAEGRIYVIGGFTATARTRPASRRSIPPRTPGARRPTCRFRSTTRWRPAIAAGSTSRAAMGRTLAADDALRVHR